MQGVDGRCVGEADNNFETSKALPAQCIPAATTHLPLFIVTGNHKLCSLLLLLFVHHPAPHCTCTLMNWPSMASGAWAVHSRGSWAGAKMTCFADSGTVGRFAAAPATKHPGNTKRNMNCSLTSSSIPSIPPHNTPGQVANMADYSRRSPDPICSSGNAPVARPRSRMRRAARWGRRRCATASLGMPRSAGPPPVHRCARRRVGGRVAGWGEGSSSERWEVSPVRPRTPHSHLQPPPTPPLLRCFCPRTHQSASRHIMSRARST